MNREIKFRGKDLNGDWHYGLLSHNKTKDKYFEWFISNSAGEAYAYGVIESTIGQFTGLYDKHGKEIYEGDIIPIFGKKEVVSFKNGMFCIKDKSIHRYITSLHLEVIGNIYENPKFYNNEKSKYTPI